MNGSIMRKVVVAVVLCVGGGVCLFAQTNGYISVDYDDILTEKPLIGENAVYFCIEEHVLDTNGSFTVQACDIADDMRCEIFRYPGGGIVNTYDWKRAIGTNRTPQQLVWTDLSQDCGSEWGPDEAGRFAEENIGMLVVCLNFNQGADHAADLVEYLNAPNDGSNPRGGTDWAAVRAANGHSDPYEVKYWEVGNESGGKSLPIWPNWPSEGDDCENDGIVQSTTAAQNNWIYGGSRTFTNQQAMRCSGNWNDEDLQESNWETNETFYVKFPPVADLAEVRVGTSLSNSYVWSEVDDLSTTGPYSKVFELDEQSGRLLFGDGVNGKKLPNNYKVFVSYESGPHDGYVDFYRAMTNVDSTIEVAASHLALIKRYNELPSDVEVDGLQLHGGIGYNVNSAQVPAGGSYFTELIGRGYFTYVQMREDSLYPMYNNSFPVGKKVFQTETALLDPCTWDDSLSLAHKYTISGALSQCLMVEQAIMLFGDQSDYPIEMFMKTGYANQAETTRLFYGTLVSSAIGKAQELLIQRLGTQVLTETSRNIPTYNIPWFDMDGGAHTNAIPKVVPVTALDSSGYLTVLAVNTTSNETITLTVDVSNLGYSWTGAGARRKSWTLRADSPTAVNDDTDPTRISIRYDLNPSNTAIIDADTISIAVDPYTARVVKITPN